MAMIGTELKVSYGLAGLHAYGGSYLYSTISEDIRSSMIGNLGHGLTVDQLFDTNLNPVDPHGIVFPNIGSWLVLQDLVLRQSRFEGVPWIDISGNNFVVTGSPGQPQSIQVLVRVPAMAGTNGWPTLEAMKMHFDAITGSVVIDSLPNLHGVAISNWFGPDDTPIKCPFQVGSLAVLLECIAHYSGFEHVSHRKDSPVFLKVKFGIVENGLLSITINYQGAQSGTIIVYCDLANQYIKPSTQSSDYSTYRMFSV